MKERLGLVEKDTSGYFYVPWDEIDATFKLAALHGCETRDMPELSAFAEESRGNRVSGVRVG